jgi:chitinase
MVVSLGFTAVILLKSGQEADFAIDTTQNQLEISGGFYGITIDIDQDVNISMVEPIEIIRKVNGAALGNVKSGYFKLEDGAKVYLNLGDSTHDWIAIIDEEDRYYINLKDEDETLDLFQQLIRLQD